MEKSQVGLICKGVGIAIGAIAMIFLVQQNVVLVTIEVTGAVVYFIGQYIERN